MQWLYMKWLHEIWLLNQSSVGLNCLAVGAFPSDYHQGGNVRGDRHLRKLHGILRFYGISVLIRRDLNLSDKYADFFTFPAASGINAGVHYSVSWVWEAGTCDAYIRFG